MYWLYGAVYVAVGKARESSKLCCSWLCHLTRCTSVFYMYSYCIKRLLCIHWSVGSLSGVWRGQNSSLLITTSYCTCLLYSANLQFPSMDIWSWCVPSVGGKQVVIICIWFAKTQLITRYIWGVNPVYSMAIILFLVSELLSIPVVMLGFPATSVHEASNSPDTRILQQ